MTPNTIIPRPTQPRFHPGSPLNSVLDRNSIPQQWKKNNQTMRGAFGIQQTVSQLSLELGKLKRRILGMGSQPQTVNSGLFYRGRWFRDSLLFQTFNPGDLVYMDDDPSVIVASTTNDWAAISFSPWQPGMNTQVYGISATDSVTNSPIAFNNWYQNTYGNPYGTPGGNGYAYIAFHFLIHCHQTIQQNDNLYLQPNTAVPSSPFVSTAGGGGIQDPNWELFCIADIALV